MPLPQVSASMAGSVAQPPATRAAKLATAVMLSGPRNEREGERKNEREEKKDKRSPVTARVREERQST